VARQNKAVLDKVAKKQRGVAFVFRHFPGADPGAKRAARAALAAQQQGKFWEMRDALLQADAQLDGPVLLQTANKIGLDEAKFRGDLQATRLAQIVDEDVAIATAVRGETDGPIYFVNGRFLAGKITAEQLTALIKEEQKKAKAWMKQAGVAKSPDLYAAMAKTWLNHDEIMAALPKG
jgi:protein-disulfide isomerase